MMLAHVRNELNAKCTGKMAASKDARRLITVINRKRLCSDMHAVRVRNRDVVWQMCINRV